MTDKLIIASRQSPLAMWQARHVQSQLQAAYPDLQIEILGMTTEGDRFLSAPLAAVGGKGLFIKELEQALLDGRADIAVHSMKDVTVDFPKGLQLSVIMQREDARDAFIANEFDSLMALPNAAIVGTSSMRRQCQIRALRPDLEIRDLRGNVNTRLKKLDDGQYDAIILATAGIKRLGFEQRIRELIEPDQILPAIGQAAIGIETRSDDDRVMAYLQVLHDEKTAICVEAERSLSRRLYGGCQLPIAAQAVFSQDDKLTITALVGEIDGSKLIRDQIQGPVRDGQHLGIQLAEQLLQQGADQILKKVLDMQND